MRLLQVEEFGVMAFGLLIVRSLELVRAMGVREALIVRERADERATDTSFVLALASGLLLYGALYTLAPWISLLPGTTNSATLIELVRLLGLVLIIQSLGAIPNALLDKELEFKKRLYADGASTVAYAGTAVLMAILGWGVWSLVWARLVASAAGSFSAWLLAGWWPRFRFSWTTACELLGYGRFIAASSIASFAVTNLDDVLLVRLTGTETLGFYSRAYLLATLPRTFVTHIVNRVAFPAYAKLADNPGQLVDLYRQLLRTVAFVTLPLTCATVLLGRQFTLGCLGEKWEPMVPLLMLLAVYGFVRSFVGTSAPVLNAVGVPQVMLQANGAQLIFLVLILYPAIVWGGAMGACVAVLLGTLLVVPWISWNLRRTLGITFGAQVEAISPLVWPLVSMCAMIVGVKTAIETISPTSNHLFVLVLAGVAGTAAYLIASHYRRDGSTISEIWRFFKHGPDW